MAIGLGPSGILTLRGMEVYLLEIYTVHLWMSGTGDKGWNAVFLVFNCDTAAGTVEAFLQDRPAFLEHSLRHLTRGARMGIINCKSQWQPGVQIDGIARLSRKTQTT